MTCIQMLLTEAKDAPDALIDEMLDYLRFLKARY